MLSSYIDQRVDELELLRRQKSDELVALSENHATPEQLEKVVSNISLWDDIGFDEKRFTVDKMITVLKIYPELFRSSGNFKQLRVLIIR